MVQVWQIHQKISETLARRMQGLGLNNVSLAKELGITETIIRRAIDPSYNTSLQSYMKIADHLGMRLEVTIELNQPDTETTA